MIKKIGIIATILSTILYIWPTTKAQIPQEIGIGEILFETENGIQITHSVTSNDIGYTLIALHLMIADRNIYHGEYQSETLETIKKLEELTRQDIIETLYVAEDKHIALSAYLSDCQKWLQKWDTIVTYMKQDMNIIKNNMESCITQKNIYDREYFEAMEIYDQKTMESALENAIVEEKCAIEQRIQYNAKAEISRKLVFYLGMLQKKYDMLFEKQEIVAKEFDIFKNKLLPDLNEINKTLQQYDF